MEDLNNRDLTLCAFATGMRLGELYALRWSQIDLNRKLINVESSEGFTIKSKKCRVIPMNDMVRKLLKRQEKKRSYDYVFHLDGKKYLEDHISKTFKKYVVKSGVNPKLHSTPFDTDPFRFCSAGGEVYMKFINLLDIVRQASLRSIHICNPSNCTGR
jgi:integrase